MTNDQYPMTKASTRRLVFEGLLQVATFSKMLRRIEARVREVELNGGKT